MSVEAWPADFPTPLLSGYRAQLPELNARTDFALGGRVRPLFEDGPDTFTLGVVLSAAQWAYFQGWYRFALSNGANWFTLPLLAAGVRADREVRITDPPSIELLSLGHVRISLNVETREGTTMTREAWEAL